MEAAIDSANRHADVLQGKAFLAWSNSHLRKCGQAALTDLVFDLQNGVALCHIVGSALHVKVRGFTALPKHAAHKLANLSLALDTAEAAGLRVTVQPQDFADMNTKLVLGFIWSLIAHEQGAAGADDYAQLREKLSALAGGAPVPNITTAFADGILFAKMIDKKKSGLINPASLDASRGVDNVGNALHLLETHFKMPHVMDAADIANNADAKAMATFLPFVVEALDGPLYSAHQDRAVFSRASGVSEPSVNVGSHSSSSSSHHAEPSHALSHASSYTPSYASSAAVASAPAPRYVSGGGSVAARTTPLRNFSAAVTAKYPGTSFEGVNVDGKSAEGQLPCQQCGGQIGSGRAFKFFQPGAGAQFVHSRCFSCSTCQRDFTNNVFYLQQNKLLCTTHFMEAEGVVCKSCNEPIVDFFVNALDGKFHETCFNCHGTCKKPFLEPKFFAGPNGMPFCPECNAAASGRVCRRCSKGVVSPIKAMDAFWHEECFCCQTCRKTITSSYVEKDGWPYHGDCVKGKQAPSVPTVPKVSPQKGGGGGGGGGYSNSSSAPPPPSSSSSAGGALAPCAGCNQKIEQGSAVTVSGKRYHASCFKCAICRKEIEGSFFTVKQGFCCDACEKDLPPEVEGGNKPCAKCGKVLVGSVVQALGKEYHKDCFTCEVCSAPFPGGSFFTNQGKPVCEKHA